MTQRNVEIVLGRLATDPDLLRRFELDPGAVVRELEEQGHALTPIELEAVAATDLATVAALAARLDPRIRRAATADESATNSSSPPTKGDSR